MHTDYKLIINNQLINTKPADKLWRIQLRFLPGAWQKDAKVANFKNRVCELHFPNFTTLGIKPLGALCFLRWNPPLPESEGSGFHCPSTAPWHSEYQHANGHEFKLSFYSRWSAVFFVGFCLSKSTSTFKRNCIYRSLPRFCQETVSIYERYRTRWTTADSSHYLTWRSRCFRIRMRRRIN